MKKTIFFVLLSILLFCSPVFSGPGDTVNYSASYTTDQLVRTGEANFYGLWIVTDGTNPVTVVVYDNTSATGSTVIPATTVSGSASDNAVTMSISPPAKVKNGIYVDVTTAGTVTYKVYFTTDKL